MPTPESEAFLAKKPTVPPTFEGVDFDDNKRIKQAQDAIIREQWVHVMMGRLVREELSKCYYREGVNHLEKCGPLRGQCSRHPSSGGQAWGPSTRRRTQRGDSWKELMRGALDSTEQRMTDNVQQSGICSCLRSTEFGATCSSSKTSWQRTHEAVQLLEHL